MDESRKKSLEFLLTRALYSMQVPGTLSHDIDESIRTLKIEEYQDKWMVVVKYRGKNRNKVFSKSNFVFYPLKDKNFYSTDPVEHNIESAKKVILDLYPELSTLQSHTPTPSTHKNSFLGFDLIQLLFIFAYGLAPNLPDIFIFAALLLLLRSIYNYVSQCSVKNSLLLTLVLGLSFLSGYLANLRANPFFIISVFLLYIIGQSLPRLHSIFNDFNIWIFMYFFTTAAVFIAHFYLQSQSNIFSLSFIQQIVLWLLPLSFILNASVLPLKFDFFIALLVSFFVAIALVLSIFQQPLIILLLPFAVMLTYFSVFFGHSKNFARLLTPFALLIW